MYMYLNTQFRFVLLIIDMYVCIYVYVWAHTSACRFPRWPEESIRTHRVRGGYGLHEVGAKKWTQIL